MAGSRRLERVGDLLKEVATEVMRNLKDPGVDGALVTITSVQVSPDLGHARFFFTAMGKPVTEVQEGLNRASGFFRREITRQVNLKRVPKIHFQYDETLEHALRLQQLMSQVAAQTPPAEESEAS